MLYCFVAVVPFYSLLINFLSQLFYVLEFALVTVTMGDHLWTMLSRLEKLKKQHQKRIAYERESGIRQEDANMFILHDLNISVPGNFFIPAYLHKFLS